MSDKQSARQAAAFAVFLPTEYAASVAERISARRNGDEWIDEFWHCISVGYALRATRRVYERDGVLLVRGM